jgi:hypothetical protein
MYATMKETEDKQVERPKQKKVYRKAVLKRLGKLRSVTGSAQSNDVPHWGHH